MCLFIVLNPESTCSEFFLELVEQFLSFFASWRYFNKTYQTCSRWASSCSAPLSQVTRKTHGQALVCLRWTITSWTVLVHVVLAPLSQMTRKTHGQAPVCLRWTMAPWTVTASARRPTLDSIRVYVHEPLSAQLPSLVAGNAPVSNDEEEPRSGSAASLGKDDGGLKQRACTGRSRQP